MICKGIKLGSLRSIFIRLLVLSSITAVVVINFKYTFSGGNLCVAVRNGLSISNNGALSWDMDMASTDSMKIDAHKVHELFQANNTYENGMSPQDVIDRGKRDFWENHAAVSFPKQQRDAFFRPRDRIGPGSPFWQSVDDDMNVLTYSAHYDDVNKPPIIRVVGVARVPLPYSKVTCRYYGCRHCPVMHSVSGTVSHFRNPNGRRYIGAYVVCPLSLPGDVLPFATSIHKHQQTSGSRPFPVHYSNSTHWRQASRVQRLLQEHNGSPQEGDLDVLASLWKQVRRGDTKSLEDADIHKTMGSSFENDRININKEDVNTHAVDNDSRLGENRDIHTLGVLSKKTHVQNDWSLATNTDGNRSGYRWNMTRCFPAFHKGFERHVLLVEMVAASRALGVDHFVFYVESVGPKVNATLQVLESLGLAEVLPWNLHLPEKQVFYKGQFPAIQDCIYRQLRSSRYVLTADVDELVVPKSHQSLVTLLDQFFDKRPACGSFQFLNSFFNINLPPTPPSLALAELHKTTNASHHHHDNNNNTNIFSLAQKYHLLMYLHARRHVEILKPGVRSKVALNPRRVLVGSVHVVDKFRKGFQSCVMNARNGLLHHYRSLFAALKVPVVEDVSVRLYGESYVREAVDILREVDKWGNISV